VVPVNAPVRSILPLILLGLALPLVACTSGLPPPQLSPGLSLRAVGPIDRDGVMAWAPDGQRIAVAATGTRLRTLTTGEEVRLDPASPAALCWSADGKRLAATYATPTGSQLRLFIPGTIGPRAETPLPGRVTALFCLDDGSVLAVASVLQSYSFGGNFTTSLLRWDGVQAPTATVINDVSVKPLTLKHHETTLCTLVQPQLAPLQDELLFTRLHDPPALAPYLKLVQVHLGSNRSRVADDLPLTSSGGRYLAAGERLVVADGRGNSHLLDPWTNKIADTLPLPGRVLATSFAGARMLLDGHLFADGKEIAILPGLDAAVFAPRGDKLLLRYERKLFLLEGLSAEPRPPWMATPVRQRLLQLRRWRSADLISHDDYLEKRAEMLP